MKMTYRRPPVTNHLLIYLLIIVAGCFCGGLNPTIAGEPIEDLSTAIAAVKKVKANGVGHEDAVEAIKVLNKASAEQIPEILEGMDGANKLATNWFRSAIVSVSSRAEKLPIDSIRAYFDDKSNGQHGRLLAFDLLSESLSLIHI